MLPRLLSFQQKYIFYYPVLLFECDESVKALKLLTENRQRTEPPDFAITERLKATSAVRVIISKNCVKGSRVLEGAENNGNKRGKINTIIVIYI